MYEYAGRVTRVVNGDTVYLELDLGFGVWIKLKRARLARIDAPELGTGEGEAARAALERMLDATFMRVVVRTTKDRTDAYGRYLVDILSERYPLGVNTAMVREGYAKWHEAKT